VPHFLHPIKVAVIEAMLFIDRPLSARSCEHLFDNGSGVSLIAYHMRAMADAGVVAKVKDKPVRGAVQSFYQLPPVDRFLEDSDTHKSPIRQDI
jgi:hypothetical protein